MTENEGYEYKEVIPAPSMYPPYKLEGEEWKIFYASQPINDDVYVVYWNGKNWVWLVAGYGPYGEPITELDENAAMILLEYFGLLEMASQFSPQKLQTMSPEELIEAGKHKPPRQDDF